MPNSVRKKFFFIFGHGWEFHGMEANRADFLVCAIWAKVPDDKAIAVTLSQRELVRIERVYS